VDDTSQTVTAQDTPAGFAEQLRLGLVVVDAVRLKAIGPRPALGPTILGKLVMLQPKPFAP
jgi:hypothetical protein